MARPKTGVCPVCESTFEIGMPRQGGSRRTTYCSARCRALKWARAKRYKKYGITEDTFRQMLRTQQNRCAGCMSLFQSEEAAHIDHCHQTGKVRGLLCGHCNCALGFVKDSRANLYQLAAYLELDRSKPLVYVIGSLQNDQIPVLGNEIREAGFEVMDNWWAGGKTADATWQEYSRLRGRTYQEALRSREAEHTFYFDRAYLNLCSAGVLLCPAGRSAHLELGYVKGLGKKAYILMEDQPERYDVMAQFATDVCHSRADLFEELEKLK